MQYIDFEALAQEFGTPLYIYDLAKIRANFFAFKESFSGRKSLICYALKANSNLSILRFLAQLGAGADCVSIGEVRRAILSGIPRYKIIFSGVGKQDFEILEALQEEILFLNLESFEEMVRTEELAKSLQKQARICIRVNPNINPQTHPYISTGLYENKFGVEIEKAKEMYLYTKQSPYLQAVGVHFHIGSQLCELAPIVESSQKIAELYTSLLALGLEIKFFDVGGGLGVRYEEEQIISLYDYAQGILSTLKSDEPTIICEPGRRIVADSGYFLTRVIGTKSNERKHFAIVDGAMNDLVRPSLYQATHQARVWGKEKVEQTYEVVGPICESGDYLAKEAKLPRVQRGDLIIFENTGAYGFSMSSNYNSRPKVAEVAWFEGKTKLIRERENLRDLWELELKCLEK